MKSALVFVQNVAMFLFFFGFRIMIGTWTSSMSLLSLELRP